MAVVLTAGACRYGYDLLPAGGDGDGGPPDGAAAFTDPTPIAEIASVARDSDPSATADLLELYFASDRPGGRGGVDIWVATRAAVSDPWGAPRNVAELSSAAADTSPAVSGDGRTIYFASSRAGSLGGPDVWTSTRASRAAAWSPPIHIAELSSATPDFPSELDPDGLALPLCSERDGDGDLFLGRRDAGGGAFSSPAAIEELNTPDDECVPFLDATGAALYFSSNRPGGAGDRDIWVARRPDPSASFDEPVPVVELNTEAQESDPWVSPDGRHVLFTSTRDGDEAIYEALR